MDYRSLVVATAVLSLVGCERSAPETVAPPTPQEPVTLPIVEELPATKPAAAAPVTVVTEFPENWFFRDPADSTADRRPEASRALENKPAPPLFLEDWVGPPQDLQTLAAEGKVVVVQFWGTDLRATMRVVERNKELVANYDPSDLAFIGVHHSRAGKEIVPDAHAAYEITYPVAIDIDEQTEGAWQVKLWPHFSVIDHHGKLRATGLVTSRVDDVVDQLLAEKRAGL